MLYRKGETLSTVFITEDAKYSDTPSSKLETVGPTLVISTKTSKLRLAFASLKALKIALFEIMLLHAWAEWYHQEGISIKTSPMVATSNKPRSPINQYIGALRELACSMKPGPCRGFLILPPATISPALATSRWAGFYITERRSCPCLQCSHTLRPSPKAG